MSGGHSLHTKDWLTLAGGAALAATGLGAAGIGPLAGLMGAGTAGAATAAGSAGALGAGGGIGTTAMGVGDAFGAAVAPTAQTEAALSLATPNAAIPSVSSMFAPGAQATSAAMPALGDPLANYTPSLLDQMRGGFTNMVGGPDNKNKIVDVLGKVGKAQSAYQKASGLLGGQPQGGAAAPAPRQFGAGASPTNLSQYMNQPNPMMPSMSPQGQMTPEMLALLLKMQQGQGGLYG